MNDESKFSVDEILEAERKAKANGEPEESEKTAPGRNSSPPTCCRRPSTGMTARPSWSAVRSVSHGR